MTDPKLLLEIACSKGDDMTATLYSDGELELYSRDETFGQTNCGVMDPDQTRALYEAMKQHFEPSPWVSVKDGLPDYGEEVIFCNSAGRYVGALDPSLGPNRWFSTDSYDDVSKVLAWMPIPEVKQE